MKPYYTWWRKAGGGWAYILVRDCWEPDDYEEWSLDNKDCIAEQLWSMRKGLA